MRKLSCLRYLLGVMVCLCSWQSVWSGEYEKVDLQKHFVNRKLRYLSGLMPEVALPVRDSIMKCKVLPDNKSLIVRYNYKKEIEHLGVSLFSRETKLMLDESICDFLERFFLELVLQKNQEDVKRKLIEFHVRLQYNGSEFGENQFNSIFRVLKDLTMPVSFALNFENKQGLATWNISDQRSLSMLFPMSVELINGMDKKEADNQIYDRLKQLTTQKGAFQDEPVKEAVLELFDQNVYLRKGNIFLIPALNSDAYYEKKDSVFRPLLSAAMPDRSLKSLFHTFENGKQVRLLLTHRQYGHFTPQIELPLNNFLAMFKRDFEIFTSAKKKSKGRLELLAVIHHKKLNYIHLLRVLTTEEALSKTPLVMRADFYSNIPQQNIKSLFNIKSDK